MKKILSITLLLVGMSSSIIASSYTPIVKARATCTGSKNCNACKNCKYCKHCAKDGGKCGVCK
jgi:hypothetical protein